MPASKTPDTNEFDASHADIGLVSALPLELGDFRDRCRKLKTYTGGKFTFRGGFYDSIRVAFVESGPGLANAKRATHALLDAHSPRWVISTGFCGALVSELKVGQIVVSNQIANSVGHELNVDIGINSDPERGLVVGRTISVDPMVRTIAEKQSLAELTHSVAVDMETYSVALACQERKAKFLAVRAVSDDLSADLPSEILSLVGESGAVRIGAVVGALWKRPGSYKDMWRLREQAASASEHLARFLDGVVRQLPIADAPQQ